MAIRLEATPRDGVFHGKWQLRFVSFTSQPYTKVRPWRRNMISSLIYYQIIIYLIIRRRRFQRWQLLAKVYSFFSWCFIACRLTYTINRRSQCDTRLTNATIWHNLSYQTKHNPSFIQPVHEMIIWQSINAREALCHPHTTIMQHTMTLKRIPYPRTD